MVDSCRTEMNKEKSLHIWKDHDPHWMSAVLELSYTCFECEFCQCVGLIGLHGAGCSQDDAIWETRSIRDNG